jgi:AbrB family looped-hinge helix DNA binding protein
MTTTVSSKGQITVPIQVREALGLIAGTKLEIELVEGGNFVARKIGKDSFFTQFQGMAAKKKVPYANGLEAMEVLRGPVETGDVE